VSGHQATAPGRPSAGVGGRSGIQMSESEIAGELAAGFASAWNQHDMG